MRQATFDRIKGVSIIVVVFVHLWRGLYAAGLLPVQGATYWAISSSSTMWCMPAFFFVSGALYGKSLGKKSGLSVVANKFDGIFYPYLVWSLIVGVLEVVGSGYTNGNASIGGLARALWEPRGIFWFLFVLFECFLLCELLIVLVGVRRLRLMVIPLGVLALLCWMPQAYGFAIAEFQMSFLYFGVGLFVSNKLTEWRRSSVIVSASAFLLLLLVLYVIHFTLGGRSLSIRSVSPNLAAGALVVLGCFYIAASFLPAALFRWLEMLGRRSMDVYLLHLLMIVPFRVFLHKFIGIDEPFFYFVVGLPLGVCGAIALADLIRKVGGGFLFQPPRTLSMSFWVADLKK